MTYAPLVKYATVDDYRLHFENKYCCHSLQTFDAISVRFIKTDFDHAFYESSGIRGQKKDTFSFTRAERVDWIEKALLDASAELYQGWDKNRKVIDPTRRVAVVDGNYVVIIQIFKNGRARFITAYVADSYPTILKIKSSPKWK